MKTKHDKDLIISLIADDLRSARLIHGLNALGLHAEEHLLYLGQTVFRLMGFPNTLATDDVYDRYYSLTCMATQIALPDTTGISQLAHEIYTELSTRRRMGGREG